MCFQDNRYRLSCHFRVFRTIRTLLIDFPIIHPTSVWATAMKELPWQLSIQEYSFGLMNIWVGGEEAEFSERSLSFFLGLKNLGCTKWDIREVISLGNKSYPSAGPLCTQL